MGSSVLAACNTDSVALVRMARDGLIEVTGAGDGRLLALLMAAFSTCDKVGLMPQARHGGSGVCALAAVGSKFTGKGFEKVHIVQTQVAVVRRGGSDGAL